jgi:hypothetical protein
MPGRPLPICAVGHRGIATCRSYRQPGGTSSSQQRPGFNVDDFLTPGPGYSLIADGEVVVGLE